MTRVVSNSSPLINLARIERYLLIDIVGSHYGGNEKYAELTRE